MINLLSIVNFLILLLLLLSFIIIITIIINYEWLKLGSLLALSPVSLHRALEGDGAVDVDDLNGVEKTSGVADVGGLDQQQDHFFSTSSSSSSALSDVPLLDDAVFHQVFSHRFQVVAVALLIHPHGSGLYWRCRRQQLRRFYLTSAASICSLTSTVAVDTATMAVISFICCLTRRLE